MAGDDRLTVKVYGNKARQDIVNEFISAAGLQLELESLKERANVSFEGPYAEFVRSANRYIPQHVRHEFVADVEALQESHPAKPTSLLSPQLRDHIHRQYHRSNAAVARNFLAKQMLFDGSD